MTYINNKFPFDTHIMNALISFIPFALLLYHTVHPINMDAAHTVMWFVVKLGDFIKIHQEYFIDIGANIRLYVLWISPWPLAMCLSVMNLVFMPGCPGVQTIMYLRNIEFIKNSFCHVNNEIGVALLHIYSSNLGPSDNMDKFWQ